MHVTISTNLLVTISLSKMGLSIKQIAQATELSEDDVLKLIQK